MLAILDRWWRLSCRVVGSCRVRRKSSHQVHRRFRFEPLEDRRVLSATTVTVSGNTATITSTDLSSSFNVQVDALGNMAVIANSIPVDPTQLGGATHLVFDMPLANGSLSVNCASGLAEQVSVSQDYVTYENPTYSFTALHPVDATIFGQSEDTLLTYSNNLPTDPVTVDRSSTVLQYPGGVTYRGHSAGHELNFRTLRFGSAYSFSQQSKNDHIIMQDAFFGTSTFYGTPGVGLMHAGGYFYQAVNFTGISVVCISMNTTVNLVGTGLGNTFTANPGNSELESNGLKISAFSAYNVNVLAGTDHDKAVFYDTPAPDQFYAFPTLAWMNSGDGAVRTVANYSEVYAFGGTGQGHDTAQLLMRLPGSAPSGTVDRFAGITGYGLMTDDHTYFAQATNFHSVLASSLGSTDDTAAFYATSGNNTLQNIPDINYFAMSGASYLNQAQGFGNLSAYAFGNGTDVANLTGGNIRVNGDFAQLIPTGGGGNPFGTITVFGFDQVTAIKKSVEDRLYRDGPIKYVLTLSGSW